ncbi:T9SS type A sorting domain-containing protein [candidate division KSB1 bacterium]|nr:T9SS type A sorting domain-containing protein [candidate division KSB1 bacterium]
MKNSILSSYFILIFLMLSLTGQSVAQLPGIFEAYSSSGIIDVDGSTYLLGNPTGGDLIQVIWVGNNGMIDLPDTLGHTTMDDSLLGTAYVGYGFPSPDQYDRGVFVATLTHELFASGTRVFVRAWNSPVVSSQSNYGDSQVYEIQSTHDSHDFGTWYIIDRHSVPVELVSFSATPQPGRVLLRWETASETENLGFHVYKSDKPNGLRAQITQKLINGAINSVNGRKYTLEDREVEENKVYYYWLMDISTDGKKYFHDPVRVQTVIKPTIYALDQNYPNPFNPSTSIHYLLKDNGFVSLHIYNVRGQLIRKLVSSEQFAGEYTIEWDGRDSNGKVLPTGTYLYTLKVNDFHYTRKMMLTK